MGGHGRIKTIHMGKVLAHYGGINQKGTPLNGIQLVEARKLLVYVLQTIRTIVQLKWTANDCTKIATKRRSKLC